MMLISSSLENDLILSATKAFTGFLKVDYGQNNLVLPISEVRKELSSELNREYQHRIQQEQGGRTRALYRQAINLAAEFLGYEPEPLFAVRIDGKFTYVSGIAAQYVPSLARIAHYWAYQ